MKIDSVEFFYLSMPQIRDISDGSQDNVLVRITAGDHVGYGECESSPLPTIAAWCTPMSHVACKPVSHSVLGQALDSPADIARINHLVRENSLDVLQAEHTLSGIDIALWDLLGKARGEPTWRVMGAKASFAKTPYASALFGDTAQQTLEKARKAAADGFRAIKFGWQAYGKGSAADDRDHVAAAREGLGEDAHVLIDAGTVWVDDVDAALLRLDALKEFNVTWLEEPFISGALGAYGKLAKAAAPVKLAGGEGAHNAHMAYHLIDHGGVGFIQIDAGRIGGITTARQVADYARRRGVTFVNHTFTSHLTLSASLQPFVDHEADEICEYPVELTDLGRGLTRNHIERDANGQVRAPDTPGLGIDLDLDVARKYLVDLDITVGGETLYRTPVL